MSALCRFFRWWWAQVVAGARLKEWPDDAPRTMRDCRDDDWNADVTEYFPTTSYRKP